MNHELSENVFAPLHAHAEAIVLARVAISRAPDSRAVAAPVALRAVETHRKLLASQGAWLSAPAACLAPRAR